MYACKREKINQAATKDDDVKGILDNDGNTTWKQLAAWSSSLTYHIAKRKKGAQISRPTTANVWILLQYLG
jgi:hypothetical protein